MPIIVAAAEDALPGALLSSWSKLLSDAVGILEAAWSCWHVPALKSKNNVALANAT